MSLASPPPKRADISVRKDVNAQHVPGIQVKKDINIPNPTTINYNPPFTQSQNFSATSIYDFAQKIMYNWFPSNNYTTSDISGTLTINNQNLGGIEFKVLGDQFITSDNSGAFFTNSKDTASSWTFIKGNLTIDSGVVLTPPVRKLFTVLYVKGDLTFNNTSASISMSQRGANHNGTGNSGGAVTAVEIKVSPNITISAAGGAGAASAGPVEGGSLGPAVNQGENGHTGLTGLQTGGGGSGWWDYKVQT